MARHLQQRTDPLSRCACERIPVDGGRFGNGRGLRLHERRMTFAASVAFPLRILVDDFGDDVVPESVQFSIELAAHAPVDRNRRHHRH